MIELILAVLALSLFLVARAFPGRRESRHLTLAGAAALLAGVAWGAFREDRWWPLVLGLLVGTVWTALDKWRERRKARRTP